MDMDILGGLASGFAVALTPTNLALAFLGCFVGTIIGALPGIGPVNGVAILIPLAFSFQLDPASALILLSCVYYGCMYGGRISSIMLNIPGDEPAIMTTLDGFPMARQGKATEALAISAVASFVGATLATIGLTLFSPLLAKAAIHFGPSDYFALYVMAFATIGGVTGATLSFAVLPFLALVTRRRASVWKAAFATLLLGTVGAYGMAWGLRWTNALRTMAPNDLVLWLECVHLPWQVGFAASLAWLMPIPPKLFRIEVAQPR